MPHIHDLYDFTASAFVIHPTESKLLLIKHRKLPMWLQPGGHIELHEDPWEGLTHELSEETGLELEKCEIYEPAEQPEVRGEKTIPLPFHINVHAFNKDHKHIDLSYVIKAYTETITPDEKESQIFGWFTLEEIKKMNQDGEVPDGILDICMWVFDKHI